MAEKNMAESRTVYASIIASLFGSKPESGQRTSRADVEELKEMERWRQTERDVYHPMLYSSSSRH